MTEFIVHIGPHKTGTTYVQQTLATLEGLLRERGICVPSIWNAAPGIPSHMKLAWAIRNNDLGLIEDQIRDIRARDPRYVAISCEALSRLDQRQIVELRRLLGDAPAQVVYYVRRGPERLPSLWQETVKFGHCIGFPEFLAAQLTSFETSEFRDAGVIDRFASVFGAAHIKVVAYSHLVERNLDIAGHFLAAFLGQSDFTLPARGWPNRSLPVLDTEVIRALNTVHARRGGEKSTAVRAWYLGHKRGLVPVSLLDALRASQDTIHLDEAMPPFASAYEDLLIRYGTSFVPPRHDNGLHELRAIDVSFIRQDYLLEPEMTEIVDQIYEIYRGSS